MRSLLFSVALFFSSTVFSGGFIWPNVEFDHAKLYIMNVPFEGPEDLDYHVYAKGVYAKSKVGNGYLLNPDFHRKMRTILSRGVDELVYGLSKCYIPRHGIIYYDKEGNPVASMTACFECERIDFWSIERLPTFKKSFKYFNADRAEEQAVRIKKLLSKFGLPFFQRPEEYDTFVKNDSSLVNKGEMFMDQTGQDLGFSGAFTKADVWTWINNPAQQNKPFEEVTETKFTAGGDKFVFNTVTDDKGTEFFFSEDDQAVLTDAVIVSPMINLPNGVQIGMSLDQVLSTFPVYDGLSNPKRIEVTYDHYILDYYIERQTLIKVNLRTK